MRRNVEFEEMLAPLEGVFDIEEALADWRWLVTGTFRPVFVTALGDLFMIGEDGAVHFLDTISGTCEPVAPSVDEWKQMLRDAEQFNQWFLPGFVEALRENNPLSHGECYSPVRPLVLGGTYTVENWRATNWSVHFSHEGRMHYAIKDLPPGTVITEWNSTKL